MNTKRTVSQSIWKSGSISLVAMILIIAGSAVASELQNGVPVSLSGGVGEARHFFLPVPVGATALDIDLIDGTGDARLYTRLGYPPTIYSYDCGFSGSSDPEFQSCNQTTPVHGTWYIMVYGVEDFSEARLDAQYVCDEGCEGFDQLQNGDVVTGLSASYKGDIRFSLDVPAGASNLDVSISGGTGDADLYLKRGAKPTVFDHDCKRSSTTNEETCFFDSPDAGNWQVMVYAFLAFSGVTLTASYEDPPFVCTPSSTKLCLNRNRFRVEVAWRDQWGNTGSGQVVPFGSADSGLFWFFDSNNWEMLVKLLNGCGINNHYWVFAAATTSVEYTLRVTDTETGAVKQYYNPLGVRAPAITDANAFATCP